MKRFLATTAITLILLAGESYAATTTQIGTYQHQPTDILASKFIGMNVYATEAPVTPDTTVAAGAEQQWNNIGDVNDVIIDRKGEVKAVVLGVGGFLGVGEKQVAIPMSEIKFISNEGDRAKYFLVVNTNKQMLTDAPAYVIPSSTAQSSNTANQPAPSTKTALVRPDVTRQGYRTSEKSELTSENLTGARVYGAKDEDIGEVDKLVLNQDGSVKQLVLDIGGFLGMGEHRVAVGLDQVKIMQNEKNNEVRVYVESNKEALKALPTYNG